MGKKKVEEMEQQRQIFVDGCAQNQIKKATAEKIFDLIEKFAGYGFNKSHSAAYAMLSYQTAYLKTYFPEHFMAVSGAGRYPNGFTQLVPSFSRSMSPNEATVTRNGQIICF